VDLTKFIRDIPNFPKPGIVFKDITPVLKDPKALSYSAARMAEPYKGEGVQMVCGAEARGFIFGPLVAERLGVGFVPVRKPGKLPFKTHAVTYELEYGSDTLEIHQDAVDPGIKILMVDDVLATGGTMRACCNLIEELGGVVSGCAFLIELEFLNGRQKLSKYRVHSVIHCKS
jgi:adenine phosphoribosyltransferase